MKRKGSFLVLMMCCSFAVKAQNRILDVGIRLQQTINLYNENGFAVAYSPAGKGHDQLYYGFSYATSRLGSALGSNAIKQDNFLLSAAWTLRKNHIIRPFGRLNVGFFNASYESKIFDELPKSSALLSPDIGIVFETNKPLKISTSFGYNLITGDGVSGPGTLFPGYYQVTLSWSVLQGKYATTDNKPHRKKW